MTQLGGWRARHAVMGDYAFIFGKGTSHGSFDDDRSVRLGFDLPRLQHHVGLAECLADVRGDDVFDGAVARFIEEWPCEPPPTFWLDEQGSHRSVGPMGERKPMRSRSSVAKDNPELDDARRQRWSAASSKVQAAVRRGTLVRPSTCEECGSSKRIHAAHYDYSEPLNVRWLCIRCHHKWDHKQPKTPNAAALLPSELPSEPPKAEVAA